MRKNWISCFLLFFLMAPGLLLGSYRDAVGWTRLVAELGEEVPLGRGVKVSLVESPPFGGIYQPDVGNFEFSGKVFSMKSDDSGVSSHATVVAQMFVGSNSSMAREVDQIDVYNANDWSVAGFLKTGRDELPAMETSRIQNHSWTGAFNDGHHFNVEAIRRLDFAIERDGFVAVAALGNDTGPVRALVAHAYNAITVGRPDGTHSRDGTWFEGEGRVRPDIVTPGGFFTSYSAPVVSSAVAVLLEEADRSAGLINARRHPQVIKSILMAGATKGPFPEWSRSNEQPLDPVFGAGQLSIYNSYWILKGGERLPGETEVVAPETGWHFGTISSAGSDRFLLTFDEDLETLTANLSWNRRIDLNGGTDFLDGEILPGQLDLGLFEMDGLGLGTEVQVSIDAVNNSQHLFIEELPAGSYALVVGRHEDSNTAGVEYGLAWNAEAPEPAVRFAEWREQVFADELEEPGISGPAADPDGDAIANLLEYALGGDPRRSNREILPREGTATEDGEKFLTLTFARPSGIQDVEYRIDVSDDLMTWNEGGVVVVDSVEGGDGMIVVTCRDSETLSASSRRFLRLNVSLLEP